MVHGVSNLAGSNIPQGGINIFEIENRRKQV
jgi:hypothetical protein